MHDPIGLLPMWSSSFVKYKSLSHAEALETGIDDLVSPCSFPESRRGGTVGPCSSWIFLVLVTEEVPVILWS